MNYGNKWFAFGMVNGSPVCLGGEDTEKEIYEVAMNTEFDNGMFEVKKYNTIQKSVAISRWKYEQNKKDGKIALALKPVRHM